LSLFGDFLEIVIARQGARSKYLGRNHPDALTLTSGAIKPERTKVQLEGRHPKDKNAAVTIRSCGCLSKEHRTYRSLPPKLRWMGLAI
jgi:hypothetical protein